MKKKPKSLVGEFAFYYLLTMVETSVNLMYDS